MRCSILISPIDDPLSIQFQALYRSIVRSKSRVFCSWNDVHVPFGCPIMNWRRMRNKFWVIRVRVPGVLDGKTSAEISKIKQAIKLFD